jgi:hypothetical protein
MVVQVIYTGGFFLVLRLLAIIAQKRTPWPAFIQDGVAATLASPQNKYRHDKVKQFHSEYQLTEIVAHRQPSR